MATKKANPYYKVHLKSLVEGDIVELGETKYFVTPNGRVVKKISIAGVVEDIYVNDEIPLAKVRVGGLADGGGSKIAVGLTFRDLGVVKNVYDPKEKTARELRPGDVVIVYGAPTEYEKEYDHGDEKLKRIFININIDAISLVPPEAVIEHELAAWDAEYRARENFKKAYDIYNEFGAGAKGKLQAKKGGIDPNVILIIDAVLTKELEKKELEDAWRKFLEEKKKENEEADTEEGSA
jgi:RPA family protein